MSSPLFRVRYSSWGALRRDCKGQIAMRALFLRSTATLDQWSPVAVQVVAPDDEAFTFGGQVLQVIPGQGIAIQLAATPEVDRLRARCDQAPADADPPAPSDPEVGGPFEGEPPPLEPAPDAGEAASDEDEAGEAQEQAPPVSADEQSIIKQIEAMSVGEKRNAALHGRKEMRLLLIRDRNKTIHPFVIKNPGITLDEVEQIARMPSVNPEVLHLIAHNKDWTRSTVVLRNLVRNPKTPMSDAVLLVPKLPMSEIRMLAKSSNVRSAVQQVARKIVVN